MIMRLAVANGISEIHVPQNGLMSTPAVSGYVRNLNKTNKDACLGAIILTASHNAGGPENDFGIKFNLKNGGPALEDFTNKTYELSLKISEYHTTEYDFSKVIDLRKKGTYTFTGIEGTDKKQLKVVVVDSTADYVQMMRELFDFDKLKTLFQRKDFIFCFDGLSGISGPYAKAIFIEALGASPKYIFGCDPLPDFGGGHPDPNLTYAKNLVKVMDIFKKAEAGTEIPDFGAACDGDADRNMILGKQFFVTPSDSLAVLAANAGAFLKGKLSGVARSMPTSGAIDKVAKKLGLDCYETPTGWKFFGNLMDSGRINLCGEESFGTGSDHIREKDGVWAILAWLSVLAEKNKGNEGKLITVENIVTDFWKTFGRCYYSR